jgi:NADH-quinone oxidoreductase subunit I
MDHPPALPEENDRNANDLRERTFLPELLKGLGITARHFWKNLFGTRDANVHVLDRKGDSLVTTVQYPEEKVLYPPGYRGLHRLVPREDDPAKPRCVACYMCATICPAQCIYIEAAEYETTDPSTASRVIEKFPKQFVIDELRCIVCGLCVDACPKDAIRMDTGVHTPSEYTRQDFVYDIPKLLRGPPVSHPSDPWFKRGGSEAPEHVHKEAHTRIGEGLVQLKLPQGHRVEVDRSHPVAITKFYK